MLKEEIKNDLSLGERIYGGQDNLVTVAALGVLAYASADIAHHVLGHGGACLALGGRVISLSAVYVDCTVRGSFVDLAGPLSNLIVGLVAIFAAWSIRTRSVTAALRLFLALVAGFNLMWFALQLLLSVATRTDDFAWAMGEFHVGASMRYGLIAFGLLGYLASIWSVARVLDGFNDPKIRLRRLLFIAWLTAGIFACITSLFDRSPVVAILHYAAPQSFILAIGLLCVPKIGMQSFSITASRIGSSVPWLMVAIFVALMSVIFLGPGFQIG